MENQVQKFDPSTLMQGVKDRIKSEFVSLIPDEQWQQMIKSEVDKFFKETETGYSNRTYASEFGILVRNLLTEEAKKRMAEYFSSQEFAGKWQNGQQAASKEIERMFIENSGAILANMFGGMFQMQLDNFRMSLQNRQY